MGTINMCFALELATRHQVSGYDAQYAVLAVTLGVSCASEDLCLQKAFPQFVLSMERFLSLPQE
jgi:predicted nucleic acid-binding protein